MEKLYFVNLRKLKMNCGFQKECIEQICCQSSGHEEPTGGKRDLTIESVDSV
jgi:hypothetical protein